MRRPHEKRTTCTTTIIHAEATTTYALTQIPIILTFIATKKHDHSKFIQTANLLIKQLTNIYKQKLVFGRTGSVNKFRLAFQDRH